LSDEAFLRRDSPPGRIDKPADFLTGLMHFIGRGAGGEYMIYDQGTYQWIVSNLPIDQYRMGGNAGIMANALSALGAKFVIPHAVQLPERQARLFLDRENILLPVLKAGKVIFSRPGKASRDDRELVHLILEFREGTGFEWSGQKVVSPRNNRFIANADDYNGKIVIDPAFAKGVDEKIGEMDKLILTGLHMLKRSYPDGTTYLGRLREALGLVGGWRRRNPDIKVHFELADVQDETIRRDVVRMACGVSDSVGMNEDELQAVLGTNDARPNEPMSMANGMFRFASSYGIGKLLVHSKDFVVSLVTDSYGVPPEVIRDSQMLGVLSAQNRARSGEFGSSRDLKKLISEGLLEASRIGLGVRQRFEVLGKETSEGIWLVNFKGKEAWVVLTPCLLSRVTLNTVGLGDCLTAGCVLGEIAQ
jgi:ADP-dependent phosphofructokinase/glucokinase